MAWKPPQERGFVAAETIACVQEAASRAGNFSMPETRLLQGFRDGAGPGARPREGEPPLERYTIEPQGKGESEMKSVFAKATLVVALLAVGGLATAHATPSK